MRICLESIERFWPLGQWRSNVVVILDSESAEDQELCRNMPSFVTCVLEDLPDIFKAGNDRIPYGTISLRAMWSLFNADVYSNADWIAIMDADSMFFHPRISSALFDDSGQNIRPFMFGSGSPQFPFSVLSAGLPWAADFMDTYPMLSRPDHFRGLREFLKRQFQRASFNEAYSDYVEQVKDDSLARGWFRGFSIELPSFHALLGGYLWHFHRADFRWRIDRSRTVDAQYRCAAPRVAAHLGHLASQFYKGWRDAGGSERYRRRVRSSRP